MTSQALSVADRPREAWTLPGGTRRVARRAPQFRREVVERWRLLARLAAARDCPVVLLCAPAGFGKTILAAQLSDGDPRPTGWIQLEDADNDPLALLNDVVCALAEQVAIAPRLAHELEARFPRIDDVVLPLLAEQLAGCDPFLLVLDDLEVLRHPRSLAILSFLVANVPPGSQLVLASRCEPEIPLARMRASGHVLDIRAADLALDARETRELLATGGVTLDDEQVEDIRERAEGWAAGIALAMLSREGLIGASDLPAIAVGRLPDVASYLLEEAVDGQPPDVRRFLLASSVLRRMSPALCDAVLEIADSGRVLATLERSSLFIVLLRDDGEWHRYHHLFRELLQMELRRQAPEVIPRILGRAAVWHDSHGDPGEAFEYARECGDFSLAGRIALRYADDLIARGLIETLRGWLSRCTPAELASDPRLALAGAWVALLSGEAAEARRLAAAADTADDLDVPSPEGATSRRSSLALLRATLGYDGVSQMLRDGELVCAAEASAETRWVMDGWRQVATAHLLDGRPEEAIAAFAEVLLRTKGRPDLNYLTIHCLGYSALAAADARDWRRARRWARDAHALTDESGLEHIVQSVAPYVAHATVLQHDGLLPQAREALAHARRIIPTLHAVSWCEADISLRCAQLSLSLGDVDGALELGDVARGALAHYPDPGMLVARLGALDRRLSSGQQLRFTPSELRLVPFLASHLSLREIGDRIHVSRATVKTHVDSIYRKLGVPRRSDAVDRLEALGVLHGQASLPR